MLLYSCPGQYVRNFQIANESNTYITFTWDIVDGYYSSSDIHYFLLYYQHRSFIYSQYIYYSWAASSGTTFSYSSSLGNFNNGPYTMWVRVYRNSTLYPRNTHAEKKYVKIGISKYRGRT